MSSEIIGPFKNGGIGTSMTGLAERLAEAGHRVTILYTGGLWQPDLPLDKWKARYAALGIELAALSISELQSFAGPLRGNGFLVPTLVYRHLVGRRFDIVHFNDCAGEGNLCIASKKLGLAFADTLLLVALHSPSEWVLEQNQILPASPVMAAYRYAERLSIKHADGLWCPSRYLVDWAVTHGFELPAAVFVQQYCLPSQRLLESRDAGVSTFPQPRYGRTAAPSEIVFFGRLEERKGLRLFCSAIHRLRHELAAREVRVTFLGKAETCGGMGSLEYIARRSCEWRFPVTTITDLGQPEALEYLRESGRVAVMPSRVDNSPCTVYEALSWGIPFLAARAGGVPDLIDRQDHREVLVECTTEAFRAALLDTLVSGAWIARPAESQESSRRAWVDFHANAKRYFAAPVTPAAQRCERVVAIVDAGSADALQSTMASLHTLPAICRIVVINREGLELTSSTALPVFNLDLLASDPDAIERELDDESNDVVLMVHAGVEISRDAFAAMLASFGRANIDGLVPAAEVVMGRARRVMPALGGDPAFALFKGATFSGGLLVRGEVLARARLGRSLAVDSAFMGLADFCVTRCREVWPYPEVVFRCPRGGIANAGGALPARLEAYGDCSATDRYYMLAAGYAAANITAGRGRKLRAALALVDLRLAPVVAAAAWAMRQWRRARSHRFLAGPARRSNDV